MLLREYLKGQKMKPGDDGHGLSCKLPIRSGSPRHCKVPGFNTFDTNHLDIASVPDCWGLKFFYNTKLKS